MMKSKQVSIAVLSFLLATSVSAAGEGFYLGVQAGQSDTNNKSKTLQLTPITTESVSPENKGLGGRAYLGYAFNTYAGIEGGFTHYADSKYSPKGTSACGDANVRENALDVVGVGRVPIAYGFGAFAKAGAAVVQTRSHGRLANNPVNPCDSNSSQNFVRPTFGLGMSYAFNPNVVTDISWTRVTSGGNGFQNADLIALGISYHFADKYCGQFLC